MKTKTEFLQQLVERYRDAGEEWPATTKQIDVAQAELSDGTYEQLYLWIDVHDDTAKPDEIEMAFQYGRRLIVGDCKQLKTDVDSYNDNNNLGHYVEVDFNFEPDLEEAAQSTVYPGL